MYAEDVALCHPLVSPLAAKSWEGSCPLWIETGQELLADEGKYIATKASLQGVPVVFEEYEAMPHCFALILPALPGARRCFEGWARFISDVVENPKCMKTKGTRIGARNLEETPLEVTTLSTFTQEQVMARMRHAVQKMSRMNLDVTSKL
jgi:hypothetical protein